MTKLIPKVSIVLPTYNGAKYLNAAIESCLNQTYQNIEIIIVDDASIDETSSIIKKFKTKFSSIKYIRNAVNKKLPASLNIGFAEATGEYLTWTSDDNLYMNEAISMMVAYLENNPLIDIIYSDYIIIDDNNNCIQEVKLKGIENIIYSNCIGPCFLYKKQVDQKLQKYSENLFLAEDYDFWVRASIYFKFYHLQRYLYYYRVHKNSLTSKYKSKVSEAAIKSLFENYQDMKWLNFKNKANIYFRFFKYEFRKNNYFKALTNLFKSFIHSPKEILKKLLKRI